MPYVLCQCEHEWWSQPKGKLFNIHIMLHLTHNIIHCETMLHYTCQIITLCFNIKLVTLNWTDKSISSKPSVIPFIFPISLFHLGNEMLRSVERIYFLCFSFTLFFFCFFKYTQIIITLRTSFIQFNFILSACTSSFD